MLSSFKAKGGMSGGTLASIMEMLEMSKEERALTSKPYCLSPGALSPLSSLERC